MPEAVIVATARSPIGRANKGSLKDMRPDDLAAQIVRALMAKVPQVKGSEVEDLMESVSLQVKVDSTLVVWSQFLPALMMFLE
jgi:acetyl-CoA acetyltransferase